MDVVEFAKLLREKFRLSIIIVVVGILVGILAYFVLPPIFECRTTFLVLESKMIRRTLEGRKLDIDTYLDFVNNETIFKQVYEDQDIRKNFDMDFEHFKRSFEITSVEDTAIVNLMVTFEDAKTCRDIAEEIGKLTLELNQKVVEEELRASHRFSESEIVRAAEKMETARTALDAFLEQHPISQMTMELDMLRNRIALEETGAFTVYPPLEGLGVNQNPRYNYSGFSYSGEGFRSMAEIESDLLEVEAKLDSVSQESARPELISRQRELRKLHTKKQAFINKLSEKLTRMEQTYAPLKYQHMNLQSELYAAQKGYEEIYRQAMEAKLEVAGKTKEMTIIDHPVLPEKPIFPKLILTILGGFFLGILSVFCLLIVIGFNRKLANV